MAQGFVGERVAGWPLALLRIGIGALFLIAGLGKFEHMGHWPAGMLAFLSGVEKTTFPFYSGFILVEKAHYELFAWLVALGEMGVGAALMLGACTRLAAAVGAFMVFNYWFAKGGSFWDPAGHDDLYIMIFLVLMFTGAGRILGLDHFLSRKHPGLPIW
jgi:thiosulfate dehydrogenase (quinone) large subunit